MPLDIVLFPKKEGGGVNGNANTTGKRINIIANTITFFNIFIL